MLMCPACGWPQEEGLISGEAKCDFCSWRGRPEERLRASGELSDYPQIVERLKVLAQFLATDVGPVLAKRLISLGLIPKDRAYLNLLATATKSACNAAFKAIIFELFPDKEAVNADRSETR